MNRAHCQYRLGTGQASQVRTPNMTAHLLHGSFQPNCGAPLMGRQGPPTPTFQARGGKLLLRTHLMKGPLLALTLEHWQEPVCCTQDLISYDHWDFSLEGTIHCCSCCSVHSRIALTPDLCAKGQTPEPPGHTALVSGWLDEPALYLTRNTCRSAWKTVSCLIWPEWWGRGLSTGNWLASGWQTHDFTHPETGEHRSVVVVSPSLLGFGGLHWSIPTTF